MDTKILRNLSYGVYIITSLDKERPTGCVANSVMQITSDPATVALSMNHDNYTNKCIRESGRFGVSILAEDSDATLIGTFGFKSGKDADKFAGLPYELKEGMPVIPSLNGYMVFKVIDSIETSTHTVFIGELADGGVMSGGSAMTYAYYHQVVKGKSPKNAPTYLLEEKEDSNTVYRCSVCGRVYDGDIPFEELPESYTCPLCKQGKNVFVKE